MCAACKYIKSYEKVGCKKRKIKGRKSSWIDDMDWIILMDVDFNN